MTVSILGYMGSGKSHVSKILSRELNFELIDLDKKIISAAGMSITEIFQNKGEIYFRKLENQVLQEVLEAKDSKVISLGGGTPAYFNNMQIINEKSTSFYLRASIPLLVERLSLNKEKRPLISRIADQDLPEFVAKHLFERNVFYNQANYTIDLDGKSEENIIEEIISHLFL